MMYMDDPYTCDCDAEGCALCETTGEPDYTVDIRDMDPDVLEPEPDRVEYYLAG